MSDINDLKDRTIRNVERLDKHRVRLGELENHPIFKIWTSVRQGGKVTLDAILRGNRSVADLEKKLGNTRFLQKIPINLDLNTHLKYVDNIQMKVLKIDNRYISHGDHEKYEEQIAELKGWTENFTEDMAIKLNELRTYVDSNSFIAVNNKEVLRDHIDQHWKIADADRDDLSIIHSWKGKLILLLEKLDSGGEKLSLGWEVATPDKTNNSRDVPVQNSKLPEPAIELLKIAKEVEKTKGYIKEKLPDLNGTDDSMVYHPEQSTDMLDSLLHAVAPVSLPEVNKLLNEQSKELIEEFLKEIKEFFEMRILGKFDGHSSIYQHLNNIIKEYERMLK